MRELIERINGALARDGRVALATVCSRRGSAPRTAGAKMLVCVDGTTAGTVGGGLMEAQTIEVARRALADDCAQVRFCRFDLTGDRADSVDLICGGKMELLVEVLTGATRPLYETLAAALAGGRRALLLTSFEDLGDGDEGRVVGHHLIVGADVVGTAQRAGDPCPLDDATLREIGRSRFTRLVTRGQLRVLAEPVFVPGTVLLYGAGHVSQPVAAIARQVGFRVEVYDDRAEFASRERFPDADQVRVLSSFERALDRLTPDVDSYIVIVTRGHTHDKTVLAQALRTEAGYIGMIGSRKKRDTIYRALLQEGLSEEDLHRVHCPIGLAIEAETPEEIAVSIVAELIRDRALRKNPT